MKAQLLLSGGVVVAGLATGWLSAPIPKSAPMPAFASPHVEHPATAAGDARVRLDRLKLAPEPEAEVGPPLPDIAVLFRRDLTAIEDAPDGRVAWIVDVTQTYQRRALRSGSAYQDGWRVARIDLQTVQLRRGREVRTVDAFSRPVIDP